MSSRVRKNEAFLRNIYAKGPFQGHGFVCVPPYIGICELPDYDYTLSDKPVSLWVPWMVENYRRLAEFVEKVGDDSVPTARLSTGTHIFAAAFGCTVHRFPDNNPCAVPFVRTVEEADRLPVPDLWKSPGLVRVFELARLVQKELGKDVCLGPPDMQSGFDTASLIWNKEDMLCAMLDDADKQAIKRLAAKCANLFRTFLVEFRKEFPNCSPCHCPLVWSPPELGPWLSNDECGAFNTAMFEEFCLPELLDLSKTFGGLGMHCCADAEHQFEAFKKIPDFYGFNRVASKRGYRPILDHFAGPAAPVHVLGWVPEADSVDLIKRAPAGTRFIFQFNAAAPDEAKAWLARMRALSPRRDGV
ncbi:MAG: hypothetical protein HY343_05985 [Lentisphaerae bacterium]|nr:hypothetical protein [Lentisphaerota bacterium]